MNFLHTLLAPITNTTSIEHALFFLRVGIGVLSIFHGYPKIVGGVKTWEFLGKSMGTLGIRFSPVFWGLAAAIAEFGGGISLVLGLGTRIAAISLLIAMIVAFMWHRSRGDDFSVYSFSLTLIVVFIMFAYLGGGHYSLDARLTQ